MLFGLFAATSAFDVLPSVFVLPFLSLSLLPTDAGEVLSSCWSWPVPFRHEAHQVHSMVLLTGQITC
jgi:hypothetical protein